MVRHPDAQLRAAPCLLLYDKAGFRLPCILLECLGADAQGGVAHRIGVGEVQGDGAGGGFGERAGMRKLEHGGKAEVLGENGGIVGGRGAAARDDGDFVGRDDGKRIVLNQGSVPGGAGGGYVRRHGGFVGGDLQYG